MSANKRLEKIAVIWVRPRKSSPEFQKLVCCSLKKKQIATDDNNLQILTISCSYAHNWFHIEEEDLTERIYHTQQRLHQKFWIIVQALTFGRQKGCWIIQNSSSWKSRQDQLCPAKHVTLQWRIKENIDAFKLVSI